MPELPEVETLKNSLECDLKNNQILKFELKREALRYHLSHEFYSFKALKLMSLKRRGRYLIINLDNYYSLVVHLGMSGSLSLSDNQAEIRKHDHVIMPLRCGRKLIYNDPRRFGMLYLLNTENLMYHSIFKNFGIEPLEDEFNGTYLFYKLRKLNKPIKNILLSNQIVVGVGNIYAAESLYQAKIHPQKLGRDITEIEAENLANHIKQILNKAIIAGGTTLRNFVNGQNKSGYFKQELSVYGKVGEECTLCRSSINVLRLSGRSSYYCPGCQLI